MQGSEGCKISEGVPLTVSLDPLGSRFSLHSRYSRDSRKHLRDSRVSVIRRIPWIIPGIMRFLVFLRFLAFLRFVGSLGCRDLGPALGEKNLN